MGSQPQIQRRNPIMSDPQSMSTAFAQFAQPFERALQNEQLLQEVERRAIEAEEEERKEAERRRARLAEKRLSEIPQRYREEFDPKLSKLPKAVIDYCRGWQPITGQGIGLTGSTGLGKTRLLCRVLMRLKCSWMYLPAGKLSQHVSNQWKDSFSIAGEAERALIASRRVRVLFLDDIGDEKNTESVTAELKELVEWRTSHELPILWTSNLTEAQMRDKHGERGAAIVRRLAEFTWTP